MSTAPVQPKPCPDCIRGSVHEGTPTGQFIKLGNVDCYYAAPATPGPHPTIIFITDVFGPAFVNNKLLADTYAKENFHVYVPDLHSGEPMAASSMDFMEEASDSFCGSIYTAWQFLWLMPSFISWLGKHDDKVTLPILHSAVAEIRALAVKNGNGKVGAVGFCWGGRYSILLSGGDNPLVDAYAAVHPSGVAVPKDIEQIKRPGLYVLAESDFAFNDTAAEQTKTILGKKLDAPSDFVKYAGTKHGFAVRGGPKVKEQRDQAAVKVAEYFGTKLR